GSEEQGLNRGDADRRGSDGDRGRAAGLRRTAAGAGTRAARAGKADRRSAPGRAVFAIAVIAVIDDEYNGRAGAGLTAGVGGGQGDWVGPGRRLFELDLVGSLAADNGGVAGRIRRAVRAGDGPSVRYGGTGIIIGESARQGEILVRRNVGVGRSDLHGGWPAE